MLTAVDNCLAAIDRQIRKNKTKLSKRLRDSGFDDYIALEGQPEKVEEETEFKIIKRKSFSAKPMMVEEAILQMNMLRPHILYLSQIRILCLRILCIKEKTETML